MKALLSWALLSVGSFAVAAGAYHTYLSDSPTRIAVVFDTSYDMAATLPKAVRQAVLQFADARYVEFGVFSEKSRIAADQDSFPSVAQRAWAPRDFGKLVDGPLHDEIAGFDQIVVYTNATSKDITALPSDWQVVTP
jgi:hypothetical protein